MRLQELLQVEQQQQQQLAAQLATLQPSACDVSKPSSSSSAGHGKLPPLDPRAAQLQEEVEALNHQLAFAEYEKSELS